MPAGGKIPDLMCDGSVIWLGVCTPPPATTISALSNASCRRQQRPSTESANAAPMRGTCVTGLPSNDQTFALTQWVRKRLLRRAHWAARLRPDRTFALVGGYERLITRLDDTPSPLGSAS